MIKKIALFMLVSGVSIGAFANVPAVPSDPCEPGGDAWNQYVTQCKVDMKKAIEDWNAVCSDKPYIPGCPEKTLR